MGIERFGIKALGRRVDLAKVDESRRGDAYLIFPMLQTGLHISFHTPKPERGLPALINVKDDETVYGRVRPGRFLEEEIPVEEAVRNVDRPDPGEEFIFVDIDYATRFLMTDGGDRYIDVDSLLTTPPFSALERVPGHYLWEYASERDLTKVAAFDPRSGDVVIPITNREELAVLRLSPDLDLGKAFPGLPAAGELVELVDQALAETERRRRAGDEVLTPPMQRFMAASDELKGAATEVGQQWGDHSIPEFSPS